jgi:hypothetical protein
MPGDLVLVLVFEDVFCRAVAGDVDALGNGLGTAEVESIGSADVRQDSLILRRNDHGVMRVDRVLFEMIRESSDEELVENAAVVDAGEKSVIRW